MPVIISGDADMKAKLVKFAAEFPRKAKSELNRQGELIMTDAKQNRVPVDLGTLRDSGTVTPDPSKDVLAVTLSFGGAAAPYALSVHENPSIHDPPSWQGAQAAGKTIQFSPDGHGPKYLENAIKDAEPNLLTNLAERLKL